MCPINNIPALVQVMAWHQLGNKPLSEPMMVRLLMHIYVTRPQWVNAMRGRVQFSSNRDGVESCALFQAMAWCRTGATDSSKLNITTTTELHAVSDEMQIKIQIASSYSSEICIGYTSSVRIPDLLGV